MNEKNSIEEMKLAVQAFCQKRDWDQFHNPKDLAIGISTEANELLDIFRFKSHEDMKKMMVDASIREHIGEELADILFFVLRFAELNKFDLGEILSDKIEKNGKKYPAEKVKGSNLKYSEI